MPVRVRSMEQLGPALRDGSRDCGCRAYLLDARMVAALVELPSFMISNCLVLLLHTKLWKPKTGL